MGCANDNAMWLTRVRNQTQCKGAFQCNGQEVICSLADRHLLNGRAYCSCKCAVPPPLLFRPSGESLSDAPPETAPAAVSSPQSHCRVWREYHRSAWESWWLSNVPSMLDSHVSWRCGCSAVLQQRSALNEWMNLYRRRHNSVHEATPSRCAAITWDPQVFSYHSVVQSCGGVKRELARVPIEPLVGFLRHPEFMRGVCNDPRSWFAITDAKCLFPLRRCELAPFLAPSIGHADAQPRAQRHYLFDLGAGLYHSSNLGGGSIKFMTTNYAKLGIRFDRILVWEATQHAPERVYADMPPDVVDVISYFNVPVNVTVGAKHNPLRILKALVRPVDFVVLKLDIDPDCRIEEALIAQILDDDAISSRIDELYYEHHTHLTPMTNKGWMKSLSTTNQTLADSYRLFHALRERGVRAHSWV